MLLKVKILHIDSGGKPIVFLNDKDADELNVTASERVTIQAKKEDNCHCPYFCNHSTRLPWGKRRSKKNSFFKTKLKSKCRDCSISKVSSIYSKQTFRKKIIVSRDT